MADAERLRSNQPELSHNDLKFEANKNRAVEMCKELLGLKILLGANMRTADLEPKARMRTKLLYLNSLIESVFQNSQGEGLFPTVSSQQLETFIDEAHTLLGLPTATIISFPDEEERARRIEAKKKR